MVEAPGTAPGSTTLIPRTVYRRSRRTGIGNIGIHRARWKWDLDGRGMWRRRVIGLGSRDL